jgi:C-terminal processing protease CtpA/Prc
MFSVVLNTSCKKEEEVIPEPSEVNSFIWQGMHDYYLWTADVKDLSDTKYNDEKVLNTFLNTYTDPESLFESLLYKYQLVDKWSFIVDDAKEIDDWIAGISETMGYDFMLYKISSTSDDLVGIVRYVYNGSPAQKAGIKRGDAFIKVNETQLTISNYQSLLFTNKTYKLSFANIVNRTVTPSTRTVNMTAVEMQEDPICLDTVFVYDNRKIGYLVYNGFTSDFDIKLNNVFGKFKSENISQLIVDLRYNGGGSVNSSIYLGSMIYGTDKTKIMAKAQYNSMLHSYLVDQYGSSSLNDYFTDKIEQTDKNPATPINTLNMKRVYFLVSDNTASASELLINGLRPLMDVKVIGINTNGKYTGSTTIKDYDESGNVNPNHKWAMQPIIVKYTNSIGVSDYIDGLDPDIRAEEDFAALLPFGDPNEDLLKIALAHIKGLPVTGMTLKSAKMGLKKVADSKSFKRFANEMFVDPGKFQ